MANTTNLNLVKPTGTDYALVSVINGNMDIIDSKVGAIPANESAQSQITALYNQMAHTPYKVSGSIRFFSDTGNKNTINIVLKTNSQYWGVAFILVGKNLYTVNFDGSSTSVLSVGHGGTMTASWDSSTMTYTLTSSNTGQILLAIAGSLAADSNFNTISAS